jgi:hypothetical protein
MLFFEVFFFECHATFSKPASICRFIVSFASLFVLWQKCNWVESEMSFASAVVIFTRIIDYFLHIELVSLFMYITNDVNEFKNFDCAWL